jgi:hypothetical protein
MKTLITLLFIANIAWCLSEFHGTEIVIPEDTVTVLWAPVQFATGYEVKMRWIDNDMTQEYNLGSVTEPEITFAKRRAGHFKVLVRAYQELETGTVYSDWADSTVKADAMVHGFAQPWKIYFKITPPSGPIVE